MRKTLLLLVLLVFPFGSAFAFSLGTAMGYDAAAHTDATEYLQEWLGANGETVDGLTFSDFYTGQNALLGIDVTLDNFFDVGANEYLSVWIDWNQDKVFDNTESVYGLTDFWFNNGTTHLTHSFTVPGTAMLGQTWMRGRITFDGPLAASGDFFSGEIEDYQISVKQRSEQPIPEPTTLVLLGTGLFGAGVSRWRKKR